MPDTMLPPAPEPVTEARPPFFRRTMTRKAGAIMTGVALVVGGVCAQVGTAQTRDELTASRAVVVELEADLADARIDLATAAEVREENRTLQAAAATQATALKTEQDAAADLRLQVAELETSLAQATADHDAASTRVTELETLLASQPAPPTSSGSQGTQSSNTNTGSVYYKNCDAVRAAGAAPIHAGQPGYAKHLDRDGDGVGCE